MILQALYHLYHDLVKRGEIDLPGWNKTKVSWALCINENGDMEQILPQAEEAAGQKKPQPRMMSLPSPVVRHGKVIVPNFLWDNSGYILGVDNKGDPDRAVQYFKKCREFHHELLDGVDHPDAKAVLCFFDHWNPKEAETHPALQELYKKVITGGNLVFRVNGHFVQDAPALREAWQSRYDQKEQTNLRQCLITGEMDVIERVHPSIRNIGTKAESALIGFNASAFCSYGKTQSYNAPVGKSAAFAYTSALNHLLADRKHVRTIGDATVVCWAAGADPVYEDIFSYSIFDDAQEGVSEADLHAAVEKLAKLEYCEELHADPGCPFYILGLSPNAARLSIRFFYQDTFGNLMKNINAHHERMRIVKPSYEKFDRIPLWAMLRETVNLNSRDKAPSPVMAGEAARAIFTGGLYPVSLLQNTVLRIRAERNVTWGRASIIKAYYCRLNEHFMRENEPAMTCCLEGAMDCKLNESCTYLPYVLGRLFAVMEKIQVDSVAPAALNRTIKDSYFTTASSTPGSIFQKLFPLSEYHMKKLKRDHPDWAPNLEWKKKELVGRIHTPIPARLTADEINCFYIGYYHQVQDFFKKKED